MNLIINRYNHNRMIRTERVWDIDQYTNAAGIRAGIIDIDQYTNAAGIRAGTIDIDQYTNAAGIRAGIIDTKEGMNMVRGKHVGRLASHNPSTIAVRAAAKQHLDSCLRDPPLTLHTTFSA